MIYLSPRKLIVIVLVIAFLIRLPGIFYGLPYHLLADEEANIYGALKMIELKTFLPVLHRADFDGLLYYPPILAYIYAILFIPAIAIMHIVSGYSLDTLKDLLILNPSVFWYIARSLSIFFSLAGIYMVYRIGEYLFSDKRFAIIAAFLYSISFLETSMANTAHHWTAGMFFALLSAYLVLKATAHNVDNSKRLLVFAGLIMGVSFGISFLVFYIPPLVLLIFYYSLKNSDKNSIMYLNAIKNTLHFLIPFGLVALLILAVHPGAFSFQALHTGDTPPHTGEFVFNFIIYYAHALWNFEVPLLLLSVYAFIRLFFKKRKLFYLIVISLLIMAGIMYKTMYDNPRYLLPLIPVLVLLSAYACKEFSPLIQVKKGRILIYSCASLLLIYLIAVYGRYEILLFKPDTRLLAKNWIENNIPNESTVITDSDRLRFMSTPDSITTLEKIDKSALRGHDRVLLRRPDYAEHSFNVYPLFFLVGDNRQKLIKSALSRKDSNTYVIVDNLILDRSYIYGLVSHGVLIKNFWSNIALHDRHDLFIGGEKTDTNLHLLELLYSVDYLGPNISVYKIDSKKSAL